MQRLNQLPVHPIPGAIAESVLDEPLRVVGLVQSPLALTKADLVHLPRTPLAYDFVCGQGWSVSDLQWEGLRLGDVLALAEPLPAARYVRVCAAEYVVPIPLDQAGSALLCDLLQGQPLPLVHGAPWRLLVPGAHCSTSVKWVDRLELCAEPGTSPSRPAT